MLVCDICIPNLSGTADAPQTNSCFGPKQCSPQGGNAQTCSWHLQSLGHVVVDDALREAFHDGGLADARLTDEARIIFRAPRQDLDGPPDLVVSPDDLNEDARGIQ